MVLVLSFIDVMNHVNCFVDVEPALHPGYKSHWVVVNHTLMYCWIRVSHILLRSLASMCIREIGLYFSFFVGSLSGFGIKVTLAS